MVIEAFAGALIMFGLVLIIGAAVAYNYEESKWAGFTIVTSHPFRGHALSLGVIGVGSILAGLTAYGFRKPEETTNKRKITIEEQLT